MTKNEKLRRSQAQEKRVAKALGGRVQPASGALWVHRNDVRTDDWLIENKRTDNEATISIKMTALRDLEMHAVLDDRMPALQIDIGSKGKQYFIVPAWVFYEALARD